VAYICEIFIVNVVKMQKELREFKRGDRRRDEQKDIQKNGHEHSYMHI